MAEAASACLGAHRFVWVQWGMRHKSATIPFAQVDRLAGKKDAGPSEGHPKVREELARQGIDLERPVVTWPDDERQAWCYRNLKEGDPPPQGRGR